MPAFGRAMLEHWLLDPDYTYLNHGTVGAPPRRVLARQQALRDEMERLPARFMLRELYPHLPSPWRTESRLHEAARAVGAFIGANPDNLVFVANATTGLNAVLQSVPLVPGDEIVATTLAYGAIGKAASVVAARAGARMVTVDLPFPPTSPSAIVEAVAAALTERTRLVLIDHITAESALVLPVAAIAAICRQRGVPLAVDGAHAPGSLALDIEALGVDWYAGNLHKWAHAPRACGILWAAPVRQASLHHPVVSWGRDEGFQREFDWIGTGDPTNYLAAPEGIALLQEWGFDRVLAYIHGLARNAAALLTERWKTTLDTPPSMIGAMVTVPLPERAGSTMEAAVDLRTALLVEDRIEVQLHAWRERVWVRVSAQVYNEIADVERLADAVRRRLR